MPDSTSAPGDALPVDVRAGHRPRRRRFAFLLVAVAALVGAGTVAWYRLSQPSPIVVAFANSLSGPLAPFGKEALTATRIYLDEVNSRGGIDGHPVQLKLYDDQSSVDRARENTRSILNGPSVAVLGHLESAISVATGPLYKKGRIPAISGQSTSDDLTADNPWYFQVVSPNSEQGKFLAEYMRVVLLADRKTFIRIPDIDLVTSDETYGRTFRQGYIQGSGNRPPKTFIVKTGETLHAAATETVNQLVREPEPRIIVIGAEPDMAAELVRAIRRRGIYSMLILSDSAGTDGFAEQFAQEPEERDEPGFFLDNVFAIAPMILDSTGEAGQTFGAQYRERTGERAGWIGAAAEDAARVTIEALRRAHIHDTRATRAVDRQKVRAALSAMTDPAKAPVGINGPLYFTAERSMPRPIRFGFFYKDRFISAPLQLVRVENPNLIDAVHEMDLGHVVQIGDVLYWVQRVVYTGIDVTHLSDVDVRSGTFQAQFYLWMRYAGTDNLPTNVEFPDLKGSFDPAHPDETGIEDRLNYRLYRVQGTFKDSYDLHDFPFDQQHLLLRLQNRQQPREQIAYVIDTFGLHTRDAGISAKQNSAAFRDLQLWNVQAVRPFIEAFSISSTIGKPELFDTANRIEYGAYATDIIVSRYALAFMVKTMIPLFLLTVVVFVTMFFPHTLGKERTTIPVTAILTSAVLLVSIGNQLPPLGYTVTLEYVFYVFFALCLMAMFAGFLTETLRNRQLKRHVAVIDMIARTTYLATVLATAAVLWWTYE